MPKQPPEVFYEKAIVRNFAIVKGKTPVLESLFNSEHCKVFNSTYYEKHLWMTASENVFIKLRKTKNYSSEILTLVKMFVFISWLASIGVCIHI